MRDWVKARLGDIFSIQKGKKHSVLDSYSNGATRVLTINDLRNNDLLKYTLDGDGVKVTKDDVLIAWDGANAGTIGFNLEGFAGSTIAALKKERSG